MHQAESHINQCTNSSKILDPEYWKTSTTKIVKKLPVMLNEVFTYVLYGSISVI